MSRDFFLENFFTKFFLKNIEIEFFSEKIYKILDFFIDFYKIKNPPNPGDFIINYF